MRLATLVVSFLASLFVAFGAQADQIDQCEYYPQKAQALGCGEDNYLLKFGYHYCRAFEKRHEKFSLAAQPVLDKIRSCLILEMEEHHPTCLTAEAHGYNSHVPCYLLNGFCGLSNSDKLHILWVVRAQIVRPKFRKVASVIEKACATGKYP